MVSGLPAAVLDERRLEAVRASDLLDSGPEAPFDQLAALASTALAAPLAFITVVDERRSYWKSCVGVDPPASGLREMPVEESFCQHGLEGADGFVVEDARSDARTRELRPVRELGVGSWASMPVTSPEGAPLGTVCVGDRQSRAWTARELDTLRGLAAAVTAEIALRDQIARTAALAQTLQESLLPPRTPVVPGVELASRYRPAGTGAAVGGDFYDVFRGPEGEGDWYVLMGDVCGKGVQAAKTAALVRYSARAVAPHGSGPAQVLAAVNIALVGEETDLVLATAVLARLRIGDSGGVEVTLARAGHPPPLWRCGPGRVEALNPDGMMLGIQLGPAPAEQTIMLQAGACMLFYTDGITEARAGDEVFGDARLTDVVGRLAPPADAPSVVAAADEAVRAFAGPASTDDQALLALSVPG